MKSKSDFWLLIIKHKIKQYYITVVITNSNIIKWDPIAQEINSVKNWYH